MDKTILLHQISPEDLQLLIREAVREELKDFSEEILKEKHDEEILLSRAEACELLKVSLTTLWNWTKAGNVTAYSIGNRVFYKKKQILDNLRKLRYR